MFEEEATPMAHPTLCEVIYHGIEDTNILDQVYTPYRLRGLSGQTSRPSLAGAPSYTDSTTPAQRPPSFASPNRIQTALSLYSTSTGVPNKTYTLPPGSYNPASTPGWPYSPVQDTPCDHRKDRAKTAPCTAKSLPTLLSQRHLAESRHNYVGRAVTSLYRSGNAEQEKVKWIPALNAWVPVNKGQNASQYLSFVNSLTLGGPNTDLSMEVEGHELPVLPCSRFLSHMHVHEDQIKALYTEKNTKLESQRLARERRRAEILAKKVKPPSPTATPKHVAIAKQPSPTSVPSPATKSPSAPPPSSASTKVTTESSPKPAPSAQTKEIETEREEQETEREEQENVEEENQGKEDSHVDEDDVETVSVSTHDNLDEQLPSPVTVPSPTPPPKASLPTKATKPSKQSSKKKPKAQKSKEVEVKDAVEIPAESAIQKVGQKESEGLVLDIINKTESAPAEEHPKPLSRIPPNPLQKRVRWKAQAQKKDGAADRSEEDRSTASWSRGQRASLNWDEDFSTAKQNEAPEEQTNKSETVGPPPPPEVPNPPSADTDESKARKPPDKQMVIPDWVKKKYGRKQKDKSWEEEQRRKRLAQERREKALEMYEKLRQKRYTEQESTVDLSGGPRFEDYGWLAQYCIFQRNNLELFKKTFEAVDDQNKGYLGPVDTILALRAVNNKLSLSEEEYLYRIMELAGYQLTAGTDFKLYAVMAALSQRIATLDDWMKHLIGRMDFSTLERKLFMCRTLWECNVDPETNTIPIDQLCVELRAGGVSYEHEQEVRDKLGHLGSLDLLDFMTYVPLFIMIHESVVDNPLDDSREK